jgi:hypothetical protein
MSILDQKEFYNNLKTKQMKQEVTTINTTDMMNISKAFYESGMFTDIKSAAQAMVKISAGAEMGIPPFAAMSGIHIIQGKPTIGAGLMAANVKASNKYDYKVVEQSEKVCSIDFYKGKELLGNSTFTYEDAKKAGTKNLDKFPKNMLFARAMSNGVKWFCPDVFSGPVYTPEEFDVVTQDINHTDITEEVNHAVAKLPLLTTVEELKEFKKILPAYVVKDASFVDAATNRYNLIIAEGVTE